jgi:putative transposase
MYCFTISRGAIHLESFQSFAPPQYNLYEMYKVSENLLLNRRQTFRLYSTKTQEKALLGARRLHCYLYNACVAHREYEYKRNRKTVTYFEQQNLLPEFKRVWTEFAQLHSQSLQATVKRVDLAYQFFFQGLRGKPKYKSIRRYLGWTQSGRKVNSNGKHDTVTLNDLGITLKMRGKAKAWALTIVYKPSKREWYASFTVNVAVPKPKFGSQSDLKYESIVAYNLGTETAITLFDRCEFYEIANPRFTQRMEEKIRQTAKLKRRKRPPKKGVKASRHWKKINQRESKLKAKVARQRRDWQHKVTSDLARRYDIGVTEKLNTKAMTPSAKGKGKRLHPVGRVRNSQPNADLQNRAERGSTKTIKPFQRCPQCGAVNKDWTDLKNPYHVCSACGFEIGRDRGSVMVMYNVALNQQPGLGTSLVSLGCLSSTSETRHTGSMKQLGQRKRQKSCHQADGETPSAYAVG